MKNYLLIVLFSLGFLSTIWAQSDDFSKKSYITFDVLSPVINYSPRYEIGYYRHFNEQWMLGAELGIGTYDTSINFAAPGGWIEKDYLSFSITPEIIYMRNPYRKTKRFISAELFYIHHTDKFQDKSYTDTEFIKTYNYESADYQRNKFGLNFSYGMIINFSNSVGIIPKLVAGFKVRDVQYKNVENLTVSEGEGFYGCTPSFTSRHLEVAGLVTRFNFNFEMQFFFKF